MYTIQILFFIFWT